MSQGSSAPGKKLLATVGGLVVVLIAGLLGINLSGSDEAATPSTTATSTVTSSASAPATPGSSTAQPTSSAATAAIPAHVWETLALIEADEWPPNDGSGTRGGSHFGNYEGLLPEQDARGREIDYLEWDVNLKLPNRSRDAERIVTGSDNSAYYTDDHYSSFTVMREGT